MSTSVSVDPMEDEHKYAVPIAIASRERVEQGGCACIAPKSTQNTKLRFSLPVLSFFI